MNNDEFNELIFSYMTLDSKQKKTALLTLLSEDIEVLLTEIKNKNLDIKHIDTDLFNDLNISKNNDYFTYLYILVRQLENLISNYIVMNDDNL